MTRPDEAMEGAVDTLWSGGSCRPFQEQEIPSLEVDKDTTPRGNAAHEDIEMENCEDYTVDTVGPAHESQGLEVREELRTGLKTDTNVDNMVVDHYNGSEPSYEGSPMEGSRTDPSSRKDGKAASTLTTAKRKARRPPPFANTTSSNWRSSRTGSLDIPLFTINDVPSYDMDFGPVLAEQLPLAPPRGEVDTQGAYEGVYQDIYARWHRHGFDLEAAHQEAMREDAERTAAEEANWIAPRAFDDLEIAIMSRRSGKEGA